MPVQLERQQQAIGLLERERIASSKASNAPRPCSDWNEPDSSVAVWGELVTATNAQDSATTATPLSEACSRRLLRHGERPRSCPGGRASGTSSVPTGTASSRRLTSGSKASDARPASAQGLGVYCSTIELAVNKKLHGRHGTSKRPGSASSACRTSSSSGQAGSLPAWTPVAGKQAGKISSSSSSRAGDQQQLALQVACRVVLAFWHVVRQYNGSTHHHAALACSVRLHVYRA
jgi:hypothetical protein